MIKDPIALTLNFQIPKSPEYVFEYLSQAERFVEVHPLIYKMEAISDHDFLVFEKILVLGFIPYAFIYPASIYASKESGKVQMKANIQGKVWVTMDFVITGEENANSSQVVETVTFRTKLPVAGIMKSLFKRQHQKLFANIAKI